MDRFGYGQWVYRSTAKARLCTRNPEPCRRIYASQPTSTSCDHAARAMRGRFTRGALAPATIKIWGRFLSIGQRDVKRISRQARFVGIPAVGAIVSSSPQEKGTGG